MGARSPEHAAFGNAIRQIRDELDMSQTELAARAGLDRTYVSGIEHGERNPSLTSVFKLARALGIAPSQIHALGERTARERGS